MLGNHRLRRFLEEFLVLLEAMFICLSEWSVHSAECISSSQFITCTCKVTGDLCADVCREATVKQSHPITIFAKALLSLLCELI